MNKLLILKDMEGEKNLDQLIKSMKPVINEEDYVFCEINDLARVNIDNIVSFFREKESITVILKKEYADELSLKYGYIAAWITLTVHSSLEAVGLTAAFAQALAKENISCNVVAAYYHDHIFVDKADADKAMEVLRKLSKTNSHQ